VTVGMNVQQKSVKLEPSGQTPNRSSRRFSR
jgi:hypothetical protein